MAFEMLSRWHAIRCTLVAAALVLAAGAGCLPSLDRPRPGDGSTETADSVPPITITCNGDCRDMVVSRVLLPSISTKAIDLDGDGAPDNALGTILLALNAAVPSLNLQDRLDASVSMGRVLILIRAQAASFTDAQHALMQAWKGETQACCTSPKDLAVCRTQATQTCFSGTHSFKPDPDAPNNALLGGSIESGRGSFGPAKQVSLALPISPEVTLEVQMIGTRVEGDLTSQGLSNGLLGGAIPKSELEAKVIPVIAEMLNNELKNPNADPSTKDTITKMFDTDSDGSIENSEVKSNGLVKTFLDGDVDVDGDQVNELSVGLVLEAVMAVIDS